MIEEMAKLLVGVGATPLSAVRAAVVLEHGGTVQEAWEQIEIAFRPAAAFDGEQLAAEVARARDRVLVGRKLL